MVAGVVVVGRLETTLDVLSPPPHPFGPGVFFAFKVLGAGGDPPPLTAGRAVVLVGW